MTLSAQAMTFEQFQASKVWYDDLNAADLGIDFSGEEGQLESGFLYAGHCYITKIAQGEFAGQYDLLIERDEWITPDLEALEKRLYRWAIDAGVCFNPPDEKRLSEATDKAEQAFWASIAESYPECTTGDLDPWVVHTLTEQMKTAARYWVRYNMPDEGETK